MTDPEHDEIEQDPTVPEPPAQTPTFEEIAAALGLPTDARAVVITPTTAVAITADYPEPHPMPESVEAHHGE